MQKVLFYALKAYLLQVKAYGFTKLLIINALQHEFKSDRCRAILDIIFTFFLYLTIAFNTAI